MSFTLKSAALLVALRLSTVVAQENTCQSFGIDFQDEGSYFQNISSSDPFTFVSSFSGCQPDLAQNLLVDPEGDEVLCTDTSLTPDNVNQISTCPTLKNQLTTGEWSVLIISNNGNGTPIAYERDLYLTVGVPTTITTVPTITITATATAVVNNTITISNIDTETVWTTATVPRFTFTPTITEHPRTTVTSTKTGTLSKVSNTVDVTYTTVTETASCSIPDQKTDKWCQFTPTKVFAAAMMTNAPVPRFRPVYKRGTKVSFGEKRSVPVDRAQRVKERKERLAAARKHEKRAPDSATVTVVDPNTADYPVVTSTDTAGVQTMNITSLLSSTTTITQTETIIRGASKAPRVTETAPVRTITKWRLTMETEVVGTETHNPTMTMTKTFYPSESAKSCRVHGGKMHGSHW